MMAVLLLTSDDIVYFYAEDVTEEPKAHYIHTFATADWEGRGYADSFSE